MTTKLDRDRDDLFHDILDMAGRYRHANRLFPEDPVTVDIPSGQWHLINSRDVEQLRIFGIHVSHKVKN